MSRTVESADSAREIVNDERRHFEARADLAADFDPGAKDRRFRRSWSDRQHRPTWRARFAPALWQALGAEVEFGTPFLFLPVLLAAGCVCYFSGAIEPRWPPVILGTMLATTAAWFSRHRAFVHGFFVLSLCFLAGLLAGKLQTWRLDTAMLGSAVNTTLTGRVLGTEYQATGRTRLTIEVISTRKPFLRYGPDRVRITAADLPPSVKSGSLVEGRVRLFPLQGPVQPFGYDFSFHGYFDGIGATGFFYGTPRFVGAGGAIGAGARLALWIERSRTWLTNRIKQRITGPNGELAAALITGHDRGIPEQTNEVLRRTGLAHILSISGLHMALVAGTVIVSLRTAFAFFPGFASRYPVRKHAAALAIFVLSLYLLISGAGIATQRAFVMLVVMLLAVIADRPAITMRNLAVAAFVVLLLAPHEVVGPSFQMSFAATAALVATYRVWAARRSRSFDRDSSRIAGGLALAVGKLVRFVLALSLTSLVAGAATGIFGMWHFHRIAPLGLLANLAAMPIVSTLVMPSAVVAVVLIPFDLDAPAFWVMSQSIGIVIDIARWFSAHTPFDAAGAIPVSSLLAASVGLVIATLPATWLRIASLPFFFAAAAAALHRDLPDVLVSEDGKLVAVVRRDASLAVNVDRPNAFTIEIWQRSLAARGTVAPLSAPDAGDKSLPFHPEEEGNTYEERFRCENGLCLTRHESGAVIAHARDRSAALAACEIATVIVIADATVPADICARHRNAADLDPAKYSVSRIGPRGHLPADRGLPVVLTAKDLARRGAADIRFGRRTGEDSKWLPATPVVNLRYAIATPWRPWHKHRAWSREARGLAPYGRGKD